MKKFILTAILLAGLQLYAQTKSVNVTTSGTLSTLFTTTELTATSTLSVSGNIDARDFAFMRDKIKNLAVLNLSGASIKTYTGTVGTNTGVQTTYPINEIPEYAFYNPVLFTYKSSLTSITLPSNLVSIGKLAFYFSWNLTGMTIPASVKSIADYSFYGCYGITSFSVAPSNTRYSSTSGVLFNKTQDTLFVFPNAKTGNYTIPTTVKHIYKSAFENCFALTSVTLPTSLLSIGSYAFSYCSGITGSLTLPASLKKIEDGGFYGCYNLTGTVSFPAGLTEIGNYCFLESNNISSFAVNTSNPDFSSQDGVFFSKNKDSLYICPGAKTGTYIIPSSVKLIGSHAFYNCKNLTGTLNIPPLVDYIGNYAFYGCTQINGYTADIQNQYFTAQDGVLFSKQKDRLLICPTPKTGNYVLPAGLITIDPGAFNNCTGLTGYMHLPATMSWIGEFAFYKCTSLSGFTADQSNTYFSADSGVLLSKNSDTVYICPLSKTGTYQIPTTVKHIGAFAFDGCINLGGIILPAGIESIGNYAFEYCTGLTEFSIPQNVNTIGNGAFYACSELQKFSINHQFPPVVDYYAFDLVNKSTCKLVVPTGSSNTYKNAPYWESFLQIEEFYFNTLILNQKNADYKYYSSRGELAISGLIPGEKISIFSLKGEMIESAVANNSNMHFSLPVRGIFVLKIGSFTEKIIL